MYNWCVPTVAQNMRITLDARMPLLNWLPRQTTIIRTTVFIVQSFQYFPVLILEIREIVDLKRKASHSVTLHYRELDVNGSTFH